MIMMPSGGSWKKVDRSDQSSTSTSSQGSRKWITSSSIDDHTATNSTIAPKFEQEDDEKKQLSSPSPTYNRCNNNTCCICSDHINYNHIGVIRVCADCHTTKIPLWRSGPTGPKSLCNACGIRQRKARRAMAAAIMGVEAGGGVHMKGNKLEKKEKLQKKKKKKPKVVRCNNNNKANNSIGFGGRKKKLGFEDVGTIRLNTNNYNVNLALPQDDKEAALLLMALSYDLLRP